MHRTGRTRAFVVTEQGQPVGVVSLQDICQGNERTYQPTNQHCPVVDYHNPMQSYLYSYFNLPLFYPVINLSII